MVSPCPSFKTCFTCSSYFLLSLSFEIERPSFETSGFQSTYSSLSFLLDIHSLMSGNALKYGTFNSASHDVLTVLPITFFPKNCSFSFSIIVEASITFFLKNCSLSFSIIVKDSRLHVISISTFVNYYFYAHV